METQYKTTSLSLASYLCTRKEINFVGVNKESPENIIFVFEPKEKAQKLADEFYAGKGLANPLALFQQYRTLKDLVFETKRATEL